MQIDTNVFEKINRENRKAAIKAIADVMEQTCRFGTFNRKYVEDCAEKFFDTTLTKVRKRTTTILKKKTTTIIKPK